jgi:hypothetical protein
MRLADTNPCCYSDTNANLDSHTYGNGHAVTDANVYTKCAPGADRLR